MKKIITTGTEYILQAFSKNEKAKQFKNDFISAFIDWVRPIFLEDDPTAKVVLEMDGAEAVKKEIIANKLSVLLKDEQFRQELEEWIEQLETNTIKEKGIVRDSELEIDGDVNIGDQGATSNTHWDRKNIVESSKIKGKKFNLGDK